MSQYRYDINLAKVNAKRTMFKVPHNYKTTMNAGDLIPVKCVEVLPGDTWADKVSAVIRELTLLNPVMDNLYIQFDAFFVPNRIIWNQTKQFFGENETGIWTQTNDYTIPSAKLVLHDNSNMLSSGSLGDYFGLPVNVDDEAEETFNYLPLRAYAMIWNYYYMAETTQAPILFSKESNVEFGTLLQQGYESKPLKVNRFADLFTTALPQPQKGENVPFLSDYLPVVARNLNSLNREQVIPSDIMDSSVIDFIQPNGSQLPQGTATGNLGIDGGQLMTETSSQFAGEGSAVPANLFAATVDARLKDINSLRIAIATQQYFELLGRTGSRYGERIRGLFGVNTPSEVINIPQYLGSIKKLINVSQVLATADSANATLGTTGAYSHTAIRDEHLYTGSFTEYGYIMILAHVRSDNTYCQGVPKLFSKKTQYDIYNPIFANMGNVAILNKELNFKDIVSVDNEVFGYAEAWYEYKHQPNIVTGFMRPGIANGFSSWTYTRVFDDTPVLNSEFTTQTAEEVDRTIAVESSISNQFKLDIFYNATASRIMPLYSIPGLNKI